MKDRTADIKFIELCDEIDQWKQEAEYWQNKYEEMRRENIEQMNESLEASKRGVANALMFALHVEDQPDGSLKINRESREKIAGRLKTE